jgi:hypothetical protein
MSAFKTRVEKLERSMSAGSSACPDCGWHGPIVIVNEYIDAEGRTVRRTDAAGNSLVPPDSTPCRLCKGRIKVVAVCRPAGLNEEKSCESIAG